MSGRSTVKVWEERIVIPTWLPLAPDKNPMFLEKRVYQGSSGKVYPLPFTDRIAEKSVDRKWQAVWLENEYLRVMILPELGGRIHVLQDKTNGYDLIYRQAVIKPALVGLAGPWVSGGIEFNWPQHHRPATFLPVDFHVEEHADGSKTVWCSDHDPMARMKGMHGVCLHPGKAYVELKVRVYNRTPFVQTFLWWANVATRVHESYQSFFPPDVHYVADHARRSMSEYPLAKGFYYGVNYGERGRKGVPANEIPKQFVPPHCRDDSEFRDPSPELLDYAPNDLSFYANIPTPCSYMAMGSQEDFFGGYDYSAEAGIVHVANHHISPGKKQWTWGNHDFGYAWDRNLTEKDARGEYGPYIEIMAGVYTDNQPDFSFLQPGETKTWSQFWYPIQKIGPAQHANLDAAISLRVFSGTGILPVRSLVRLGVSATKIFSGARIVLTVQSNQLFSAVRALAPGKPFVKQIKLPHRIAETDLCLRVTDADSREIISYQPKPRIKSDVPSPATEPLPPEKIASTDELFISGLHLEQYRHATRSPVLYWQEALRRDPLDLRCNNAMGLWHLRRGEFGVAEKHFRKAIERLTSRNANPYDGEAYYNLGLCLRFQNRDEEAYAAFYKATWNAAWQSAGYHALAEIDCKKSDWPSALEHLDRSLRCNTDNLRARNLKMMVLRMLDRKKEAGSLLRATLILDPLDCWARMLSGQRLDCDLQVRLDIAHDLAWAGFFAEAIDLLGARASARFNAHNRRDSQSGVNTALPDQSWGAWPLVHYGLGWMHEKIGETKTARKHFHQAATLSPDYCFPSRLEEIGVFKSAMHANPKDARAPYYLGNLFYDRRRHAEAIQLWEKSAKLDPKFSVVWRNLGIGYFNVLKNPGRARAAYDRALRANPADARLLYERDQLWKRTGVTPGNRLRELEKYRALVGQRDDLTVEYCALLNQAGRHLEAMQRLAERRFQPWEGGEGGPLEQHVRTQLALGRDALRSSRGDEAPSQIRNPKSEIRNRQSLLTSAATHFRNALTAPENLGEARHLLANQSDIHYWLGVALDQLGDKKSAREHWLAAANFKGDFQEMSVRTFSEMTFYSALSLEKLGQRTKARKLQCDLLAYAQKLAKTPAKIDYFATSLPAMLLFEDDLQFRQETTALFLQAQACLGLGQKSRARKLLSAVLKRDPNYALAADLATEFFGRKEKP